MYAKKTLPALVLTCLISACQGRDEQAPSVIKPTISHQSKKEKTIVVPPEVSRSWRALKIAVIDKASATENIYTIPIGASSRIPKSNLTIAIEAFLPSFVMVGSTVTSSSNELKNPGVKLRISENGSVIFSGWVFSNFPSTHAFMHPKFGLALVGAVPATK